MPVPNLKPADFLDVDTFGLAWKNKYVMLSTAMPPRQDNKGNRVSLPAGAIGYVASATSGTILVAFGPDPKRVPEATDSTFTVASSRYSVVITLGFNDWRLLKLRRTA